MILTIIVPCYNEEEVIEKTTSVLRGVLDDLLKKGKIEKGSGILYVNDGSYDKTWELITKFSRDYENVDGISLSRNVGHQNALLAGLFTARGDVTISIDADLQDDVTLIESMIDEHRLYEAEIVYAARRVRTTDTAFKRSSAQLFYKLLGLLGVNIVYNHADYRLMSKRAVEALKEFGEINLFLRGIIPLLGFKSSVVYYERAARYAGASKYSLRRMLAFALDGVTSFSVTPLRLITALGFAVLIISALISIWVFAVVLFTNKAVPGWASTVLPIYFIGGIQIFSTGVLGEYIGKIYKEVKKRPRYIIDKSTY